MSVKSQNHFADIIISKDWNLFGEAGINTIYKLNNVMSDFRVYCEMFTQ